MSHGEILLDNKTSMRNQTFKESPLSQKGKVFSGLLNWLFKFTFSKEKKNQQVDVLK